MALAFISYRRQDSSAAARWLYRTLGQTFGPSSVFMDIESIRAAANWKEQIEASLRAASLLIVVIGPNWLRLADGYGRRRLDDPEDWVRREIAHGLAKDQPVLPILLAKVALPPTDALPEEIAQLTSRQAFELRDERWEVDLAALMTDMERFGFRRSTHTTRLPKPRITLAELQPTELRESLATLPDWELVVSDDPGREPRQRTELRKSFEFKSFESAMRFMSAASEHIAQKQHHPRWENVWRTVTIWLTTWDIGSKPSKLDLELAQYFDEIFAQLERGG